MLKFMRVSLYLLPALMLSSCNKDSEFFKKNIPDAKEGLSLVDTGGSNDPGSSPEPDPVPNPSPEPEPEQPVVNPPVVVAPPSEKDICDPLKEEGEGIVLGHGLVGKLYDGASCKVNHFTDLLKKGTVIEGNIYMSKLDIPTRKFELGFPRENGTLVMNSKGAPLIENFGIEFTGSLELLSGEEPGYYEVGLLADDGVVLEVGSEGSKIIDGDHQTATKFFCSDKLVRMEAGKSVPMKLSYFQGPRHHIALIMIWRKVASLSEGSESVIKSQLKMPVKETRCGIAGNSFFFDPNSDSHPQMEYLDLFDPAKRAVPWSIVKHRNFRLPSGYSNKECVAP